MKGILVLAMSFGLFAGAFAQRKVTVYHAQPTHVIVSRPAVGLRVGVGYPYYGYGYGARFGSPYYYGAPYYSYRPYYGYRTNSRLDLQVQSIKLDYKKQIKYVRHDKSITHAEKRQQIRDLKNEREQAIVSAQQNFMNRRNNRAPQYNGNSSYHDEPNTGAKDDAIQPGNDNTINN